MGNVLFKLIFSALVVICLSAVIAEAKPKKVNSINDSEVREVIVKNGVQLSTCFVASSFKSLLKKQKETHVDLEWKILKSGKVEGAKIKKGDVADKVKDCLVEKVAALEFKKSDEVRLATHRITRKAKEGPNLKGLFGK